MKNPRKILYSGDIYSLFLSMKFFSFLILLILLALLGFGYMTYIFPQTTVVKQDFIVNRGDTLASLPKKL